MKRRSRGERGGERHRGPFFVKTKAHKEKRETLPQRSRLVGQDLNCRSKQQHQLQTHACVHACWARHAQNRAILRNNVFSSMAASLVGQLALWPGTALKTTIMTVTSRCLGTIRATICTNANGRCDFNRTLHEYTICTARVLRRAVNASFHYLIRVTKICDSSKICWHL